LNYFHTKSRSKTWKQNLLANSLNVTKIIKNYCMRIFFLYLKSKEVSWKIQIISGHNHKKKKKPWGLFSFFFYKKSYFIVSGYIKWDDHVVSFSFSLTHTHILYFLSNLIERMNFCTINHRYKFCITIKLLLSNLYKIDILYIF